MCVCVCFSYKKCVEEFVKGDHSNVHSVIKAQLVCEQQLRYDHTCHTRIYTALSV